MLASLSLTSHHEAWILTVHGLGVRDPWIRLSHGHIRSHNPHLCFLDEAWLKILLRTEVCILIGVESLRRQSLRGQLPIPLVLSELSAPFIVTWKRVFPQRMSFHLHCQQSCPLRFLLKALIFCSSVLEACFTLHEKALLPMLFILLPSLPPLLLLSPLPFLFFSLSLFLRHFI